MKKTEIERRNDTKINRIIYFKLIPTSEALATQDRGRDLPINCNNIFSRISRIRLSRPKLKLDSHLAQAYHGEIELSACFELYQQCRRSYFLFNKRLYDVVSLKLQIESVQWHKTVSQFCHTLHISELVNDPFLSRFECLELKYTTRVNPIVAKADSRKTKPLPIKTYESSSSTLWQ